MSDEGYIYDIVTQGECNYIGHEVSLNYQETAHFLKDRELYGHQAEYRFIFHPIIENSKGKIIHGILHKGRDGVQTFGVPVTSDFIPSEINAVFINCRDIAKIL